MDISEYTVHRDKQLWLYETNDGCLPVFVREVTTESEDRFLWIVWPALHFLHAAHKAFYNHMHQIAKARSEKFLIFDDHSLIQATFRQAYGVTPEFYHRWGGAQVDDADPTIPAEEHPPADAEEIPKDVDEDFLREVVSRTQICNVESMRIIFRAITQVAVNWMLSKRRPINFGFMTVFAVPYRQNWKSILLGCFPKSYSIFSKPMKHQQPAIEETGLSEAFCSRQLLDVAPMSHWFHWKIECIPSTLWDQVVERVETKRMSSGKANYADFIARTIIRQRDLIVAAYRYFICRSVQPCGRFDPMAEEGSQIIIPHTPKGGVRPRPAAESSSAVVVADRSMDYKRPKLSELVEREIEAVHRLPNVRRQVASLRISGGYLESAGKNGS